MFLTVKVHLCCIQSLDEAQTVGHVNYYRCYVCYSLLYNKLNSMYVWIGCYLRSIGGQTHKIINDITV